MSLAFDYNAPLPPRNGALPSEWAAYKKLTGAKLLSGPVVSLRPRPVSPKVGVKAEPHIFVPFCMPPPMGCVEYEEPIRISPNPSMRQIIDVVAGASGLSTNEILAKRRGKPVVLPRQIAMFLAVELTEFSYPQIGERMGFDHSTVIYSHRCVAAKLLDDSAFSERVASIRRTLSGVAKVLSPNCGDNSKPG